MGLKQLLLTIAAFSILFALGACAGGSSQSNTEAGASPQLMHKPDVPKGAAMYSDASLDYAIELRDEHNNSFGSLQVTNDTEQVVVSFDLDSHYAMDSAEVYVGTAPPASQDPAGFPYKQSFSQAVNTYSFYVPMDSLGQPGKLYIAAHAGTHDGMSLWAGSGSQFQSLAQSAGIDLAEMNLAGQDVNTAVQTNPQPKPNLDSGPGLIHEDQQDSSDHVFTVNIMPVFTPVTDFHGYTAVFGNSGSTWGISFSQADWQPFGSEPMWRGWCVDQDHAMYTGIEYQVQAWSCYDPGLPAFARSNNWDMISYMLTQRNLGTSAPWNADWTSPQSVDEFQQAVWYFKGGGGMPATNSLAYSLVQDALKKGDGFVPAAGEFQAVILMPRTDTTDPTERAQMNIIETEIEEQNTL